MLTNTQVYPILPVADLARARKFYEDKLGLNVVKTDPSPGVLLPAGGDTNLYLYQRAPTKADHTVASFRVKDVEGTVKDLKSKGVAFEEYNLPAMGIKTAGGVATMGEMKAVWFKDTEGNILAISNA